MSDRYRDVGYASSEIGGGRRPAVLVVDGETVTSDPQALAGVTVTAEVVGATKGPKITIHKFKNKTGYRKRQGHRQRYTEVKVTSISAGK